ncbi:hypothetical protein B0A53_05043 [Rhodotorula sp. CCFEE 5036]|nr:hypothetical protein B0A53_05043 [Rhodotorula sp. CCFEE 5036]
MQNAYRPGPTLETIPTELKLEIASHLEPDVPLAVRWSEVAQREAQNTESLLELARDWVPRYGTRVKTLVLVWWTQDDIGDLRRISRTPERQQAIDAAKRFIGPEIPPAPDLNIFFKQHDALIATILRACSNLVELKVIQETDTTHFARRNEGIELWVGLTKAALQQIIGRIASADLFFEGNSTPFESSGGAIGSLNLVPNVKHLGVHLGCLAFPAGMHGLFDAVFAAQQLLSLELHNVDIAAGLDLPHHLTTLILSGIPDLNLRQLANILTSRPVVSLCLRAFSISDDQTSGYSPGNLQIEQLSISGSTPSMPLEFFDSAPLKIVELVASRRGGSDLISPERVVAFVKKHRKTLLSFKIDRALLAPSADVSAINRSLEEEGISVRVVTVE